MRFIILLFSTFASLTLSHVVNARPIVSEVRVGENGITTRLVLSFSENVKFELHGLEAPHRLVIDFPSISWGLDKKVTSINVNSIKSINFADLKNETSRVVLDLRSPVEIKNAYILEPEKTPYYKFILDFDSLFSEPPTFSQKHKRNAQNTDADIKKMTSETTIKIFEQQVKLAKQIPKPNTKPGFDKYKRKKIVVVIDPGHGGKDPGAVIGKNRYFEKDIAFAAAKALKVILETLGYKAILSRSGDYYISLGERLRIAQINNAALFVSLHADKHQDKDINGIAVYTLSSRASDAESEALAKRENEVDIIFDSKISKNYDQELRQILISLFQRTTMTCSAQFANQVVYQLRKSHKLLRSPHRFAGFKVLKSPKIPSVLIEMGYLSNLVDRKNLLSNPGRYGIVLGIAKAIDAYFDANKSCLISS